MEEAYKIFEYLPLSYKTIKEQEYINFLWETFEANYEKKKYQFAFLAYHMLYMSFVYFIIWQIKSNKKGDFDKALVAFRNDEEKELLEASSPFVFHKVNESMIFRFLKLIGCDKSKIGNYTKMVKDRNSIAHSCGNIFFSAQETIDEKISTILSLVEEIQSHSRPIILSCFENFLLTSYDPEGREYSDDIDQIKEELIHKNYLSEKDVNICLKYNIQNLSEDKNFERIKEFYNSFEKEYEDYMYMDSTRTGI